MRQDTRDERQETKERQLETGNKRHKTKERQLETGDRRVGS